MLGAVTASDGRAIAGDAGNLAPPIPPRPLLTPANGFVEVARGNPIPHKLRGEALVKARLTSETWRLEVIGDDATKVAKPLKLDDGTALDLQALINLSKSRGVKFLKAMQCLNIAQPLGQGLWEGVPLRDVLQLVGKISNVRRVHYCGFHNNDPSSSSVRRSVTPRRWRRRRANCRRFSPTDSTANRCRWNVAARCEWSCRGRMGSSRSSGFRR